MLENLALPLQSPNQFVVRQGSLTGYSPGGRPPLGGHRDQFLPALAHLVEQRSPLLSHGLDERERNRIFGSRRWGIRQPLAPQNLAARHLVFLHSVSQLAGRAKAFVGPSGLS